MAHELVGDRRVRDRLELVEPAAAPRRRVAEDDAGQRRPVDRPIGPDDGGAEVGDDPVVRSPGGLEDLSADRIDIDDAHPLGSQQRSDGGLAGTDPTGEPDDEWPPACVGHGAGVNPMWSSSRARRQKLR